MNLKGIEKAANFAAKQVELSLRKHSPDILMGIGIVGIAAGAFYACKATMKLDETTKKVMPEVEKIKETRETISEKEYNRDLTKAYTKAAVEYTKLYIGPAIIMVAGISCVVSSHNMMKNRVNSLAGAYTVLNQSFKEYRSRVKDALGEETEKKIHYGIKDVEVEEVDESTGEVQKKTVQATDYDPNQISPYARIFDELSRNYRKDAEDNYNFVKLVQFRANQKLKDDGFLLLNTVYRMLDIPESRLGATHGWIYDPDNAACRGDNYVDFGLTDIHRPGVSEFVNGYERAILLDFNCDGYILDTLPDEMFDPEQLDGYSCQTIHYLRDMVMKRL